MFDKYKQLTDSQGSILQIKKGVNSRDSMQLLWYHWEHVGHLLCVILSNDPDPSASLNIPFQQNLFLTRLKVCFTPKCPDVGSECHTSKTRICSSLLYYSNFIAILLLVHRFHLPHMTLSALFLTDCFIFLSHPSGYYVSYVCTGCLSFPQQRI